MKRRNFLKSHQIQQYKRSRFENPYFSNQDKPYSFKRYLFIPISVFLLVVLTWAAIVIPWMHISDIQVSGLITVQPSAIEESVRQELMKPVLKLLPGNHTWFYSKDNIKTKLENEYQLKNIQIQRKGRILYITAEERIKRFVWISNNVMIFLDENGQAVRQLTDEEKNEAEIQINTQKNSYIYLQSPIIAIWDTSYSAVDENYQLVSGDVLGSLDIFDNLLRSALIYPISYIIDNPNQEWLIVKTTLGVDIYFDGVGDPQEQFKNLELIVQEYKNALNDLEYIDLRFGNKVYLK
ncbi:hypothetical protein KJ673_02235 [Patescibacteria group bacterium]|nr:hypothetical protein [Patescibacteria group bacterium]MCG2687893.1 hypothetical protein [Candidatus Parcubacteria bacterium]